MSVAPPSACADRHWNTIEQASLEGVSFVRLHSSCRTLDWAFSPYSCVSYSSSKQPAVSFAASDTCLLALFCRQSRHLDCSKEYPVLPRNAACCWRCSGDRLVEEEVRQSTPSTRASDTAARKLFASRIAENSSSAMLTSSSSGESDTLLESHDSKSSSAYKTWHIALNTTNIERTP